MANCATFLQAVVSSGQANTLEPLNHNVLTPLSFSRATCKSYLMVLPAFTVIDFTVQVTPTPANPFLFDVKFYRVNGNTMTEIATASSTDQAAVFSKEFTQGTYIVCFQTSSLVDLVGTVLAVYRGYQRYAVFDIDLYSGESLALAFDDRRPPKDCSAVLHYEIVEGSLPPGIRMTGLGQLLGVAPNLDCIDDNAALSPSQNWSFQHNDGTFHPWGRQWRFKVKVMLEGIPDVFSEEWFCVKIHNNWSIDRDNFLAQAPYSVEVGKVTVSTPTVIPRLCPDPDVLPSWEPVDIPVLCESDPRPRFSVQKIAGPCPECEGKEEVVEVVPIPFGVPSLNPVYVKAWWGAVKKLALDSFEYAEFVRRLEKSPVFQLFLQDRAVQVTEEGRAVVLRTYSDDPNMLFWKWRREESLRMPWGLEVVCGESLSINITDGNRT